jgi:ubiquinone/menaquinone biosynthesis C-methylase UbiE
MTGGLTPARRTAAELLDEPCIGASALAGNLDDLHRANRWLGGLALVRRLLWPAIAALPPDETVRVLDVGTGGADVPRTLVAWARRERRRLTVVGLDRSAPVLAYAGARIRGESAVRLVRADADALPFGPGSFDYVLCCLTLHHLAPAEAVAALAGWAQVARRAVVVVDLERSWPGYVGTWLWSRACTANPLTRHDGPLSVLRAYTAGELRALTAAAGLARVEIYRLPLFRLALVARRDSVA